MRSEEYWIERNKKRMTPYWKDADFLENRLAKEYDKAYKELEKEFYTFVAKNGTDGQLKYSSSRIIALMKELKLHIDSLYSEEQTSLTDLLQSVYKDNYFKGLYELSIGFNIGWNFVGVDERAIKTAISYPWSGSSFSDRIYNNKNKLIITLKEEITKSLIRGDAPRKTIGFVSDRLNIAKKNAAALVQTETAAVISSSDKAMYKEFGVEEYIYVATLDNRTSTTCRELDGQVFKLDDYTIGVNAPPTHPRCRSTTAPYYSEDFGRRISKRLDNGQAEYVPSNMSYREWEKKFIKQLDYL